jgi:molecular chaperone GrpE (heat shock protein)
MAGWLTRFLGHDDRPADPERLLTLQREVQELRLQLDERTRQLARLREEGERERAAAEGQLARAVQDKIESLLNEAAGPVAHLLTQAHLLETEGKPVQARDVLAVARRLVRVLEDEGLTAVGHVGERAAFDPDRHAPLGGEVLARGQAVVVRFVGVSCRGRLLRKAGVEREQG